MIVKVTAKHIKRGRRCSASLCPIALAIKAAGRENKSRFETVSVGGDDTRIKFKMKARPYEIVEYIELPRSVQRFIERFDDVDYKSKGIKPFTFKLSIPSRKELNNAN